MRIDKPSSTDRQVFCFIFLQRLEPVVYSWSSYRCSAVIEKWYGVTSDVSSMPNLPYLIPETGST